MAIVILVLVWWKPAALWAQIIITIAAALILISGSFCYKQKEIKTRS